MKKTLRYLLPLVLLAAVVTLVAAGKNTWTWQSDGDNHGTTAKLAPCWYYYEASF